MRLAEEECWVRLAAARHGVLATVHAERGVDAVPVVFAVVEGTVVVPVDRVKPKRTTRLQRLANIAADDRCALLVEQYVDDWSALWWVRVHGSAVVRAPDDVELEALATRYPQYRGPGTIADVIVLTPSVITGWVPE